MSPDLPADATRTDSSCNFGEVARVFPPTGDAFARLYAMRNDTESRHTSMKARLTNLSAHVDVQGLQLLGAAATMNSVAWQLELQSHGLANVFDDTT